MRVLNRTTLRAVAATALLLVAACTRAPEVPFVGTPPPASTTVDPSEVPTGVPTDSLIPATTEPADVLPVDGLVLPIAARDGASGLISCGGIGPFALEELAGPFGAENLPGPEYDVLRQIIAQYGRPDNPEHESLGRATFTDAFRGFRDGAIVGFLGDIGRPEGVYASATARFNGTEWAYGGVDGGCIPVGAPGEGWYDAIWVIDPSFDVPTAETRDLHLLVRETYVDCAMDVPITGRLSPAWVFLEQERVRIHLFSQHLEPSGQCTGVDPTPVTVTLPEPLGDRVLKDVVKHDICYGCGG
jgi:hypothetical protein